MNQKHWLAALLAGLAVEAAFGQATIQGIGDLPGGPIGSEAWGVSGDGSVVVGNSSTDYPGWPYEGAQAARWTRTDGISSVGYSAPPGYGVGGTDASSDGSVIVGIAPNPDNGRVEAFRWTEADGGIWLKADGKFNAALAVSSDGSAVVGRWPDDGAFRWTEPTGMESLGNLGGGPHPWAIAFAVSADGAVVAGESRSPSGYEAFRWTEAEGMVGLGDLPGGDYYSTAWAISADGTAIMGCSASDKGMELFRWTHADGMVGLGLAPPGTKWNVPNYANADGSVVVGFLTTNYPDGYPFIWTEAEGARPLRDVLVERGAPEAAEWKLAWANGISDDGRTIVGTGDSPQGHPEGWVATLPPACVADLDGSGTLDLFDFLAFANLFNGKDPAADCDADGAFTLFDFLCFTNAFNAGC